MHELEVYRKTLSTHDASPLIDATFIAANLSASGAITSGASTWRGGCALRESGPRALTMASGRGSCMAGI